VATGRWLTPDTAPTSLQQIKLLWVPVGEEWESIIRGALAPLFDSENFEQFGSFTPEETAEKFTLVTGQTMAWQNAGGLLITGEIRMLAGEAPPGWLLCDGAEYEIATYPDLHALIGTTFGGDGVTYFAVPDFMGRSPVGAGPTTGLTERAMGDTGGEETHLLVTAEMPGHVHSINHNHAGSRSFVNFAQGSSAGANLLRDTGSGATVTAAVTANSGSAGGDTPHENMHPFLAVGFYIYSSGAAQ